MKKIALYLVFLMSFPSIVYAGLSQRSFFGPNSSTDNAIVVFDGSGGNKVKNSSVTIDSIGSLSSVVTDTTTASVLWSDIGTPGYFELNWEPTSDAGVRFGALGYGKHSSNGNLTGTVHYGGLLGYGVKTGTGTDALVIGTEGRCGAVAGTVTICAANTATFDTDTENAGTITFGVGYYLPEQADDAHIGTKFSFYSDDADFTLRNDGAGQFGGALTPVTTDGAALGSTSLMWSDLFLASGGVINANNGGGTITYNATNDGWQLGGASLIMASGASGTFANKPATPATGQVYFATDIGTGTMIVYTGSKWKPVGGRARIHQTGVQGTMHTGNTDETNVGIVTIPAGLLSVNGALETTTTWAMTGTANTKSTRIKFSATSGGTNGTNIYSIAQGATVLGVHVTKLLINRNSLSSQIDFSSSSPSGVGTSTAANTTTAINTANEAYFNFTCQLADGADSCGLDAVTVDWIEP